MRQPISFLQTEWYSVTQLAALNLPGLPTNKRVLNRRIAQEGWANRRDSHGVHLVRKRKGRGGGMEYHIVLLPGSARLELARRQPALMEWSKDQSNFPPSPRWKWFAKQPQKIHDVAHKREAILKEVVALQENGHTTTTAVAVIARKNSIGYSTLWSWLRLVRGHSRHDWLPALAPLWKTKASKRGSEQFDMIYAEIIQLRERLSELEELIGLSNTRH